MPIVSLAALTILDAGPVRQIEAAAKAGFSHVGLRLQPLLESDAVVVGDGEREDEVAASMARTGIQLLEAGVFPIRAGFDFNRWEPVVAYTARLGGKFLVCPVEARGLTEQVAGYHAMTKMADRHGLEALVEFNPYSGCTSLDQAVAVVEAAGSKTGGLVIDVFHLSRSGGRPEDLARIDQRLIKLVHFCDAAPLGSEKRSLDELKAESRKARMLPGEGALWLDVLLDVLPGDVPLSVEAPSQSIAELPAEERAARTFMATMEVLNRVDRRAGG